MAKIKWHWAPGKDPIITDGFSNSREAWRSIHEGLEEAFGDNYGEAEIAAYEVVEY